MKLSDRINNIEGSKSVGLASIVAKMRAEGKDIIGLNVGEPDFNTPQEILDATKRALDENKTRYSLVHGIIELREELAKKFNRDHGMDITLNNVFLSNGSKHTLYNIFQAICNEGDEIIVPVPYWVSFPQAIKLAGGVPVYVESKTDQLDLENIKKAITKKTRAIIINSPNNPTGAVYPEEVCREIAQLAREHDFYIISDEAYELLLYDGLKHFNIGTFSEDAFRRTITVQSFSKSYCMTGFRMGYMVAHEDIIEGVNKLQSHLSGNNCTFAQYGALAALHMSQDKLDAMVATMQKRRDLAFELCSELFEVEKPQGAFYVWPKIGKYKERFGSDIELAKHILLNGVAILPGSAFGDEDRLRICFAPSEEEIREGFRRIKEALK